MARVVLVTDTTADLPASVATRHGILVAKAKYALQDHVFEDGAVSGDAFYERMRDAAEAPSPFGTSEASFRELFAGALDAGFEPVCVVAPFDVNPSFTTAIAAMLSFDDAPIKVINPGVSSAGLCSLLVSLAVGIERGWSGARVSEAIDAAGPECDTLFVPASLDWLERSGRLALIEEKLGELDGRFPVVRAGSRVTGAGVCDSHAAAIEMAVERAGARVAAGNPLIVTIDHAADPALAARVALAARARWDVADLIITELSATMGSQFGPGAVGIGVAPMPPKE